MSDDRTPPHEEKCKTTFKAVKSALYADDHGNGVGCTKKFVVEGDEYDISVVRKSTLERGPHFLFTVRPHGELCGETEERVVEDIRTALGIENTDVTIDLKQHGNRHTAIVPVDFRRV